MTGNNLVYMTPKKKVEDKRGEKRKAAELDDNGKKVKLAGWGAVG